MSRWQQVLVALLVTNILAVTATSVWHISTASEPQIQETLDDENTPVIPSLSVEPTLNNTASANTLNLDIPAPDELPETVSDPNDPVFQGILEHLSEQRPVLSDEGELTQPMPVGGIESISPEAAVQRLDAVILITQAAKKLAEEAGEHASLNDAKTAESLSQQVAQLRHMAAELLLK